jgi:acetyltransferase-like isoleucine patch superfamily enzyme
MQRILQTAIYSIRFLAADFVRYLQNTAWRAHYRIRGVVVASGVQFCIDRPGILDIGVAVSIGRNTLILVTSEGQDSVASELHIGAGTAINEWNNIRASGGTISIGRKCLIAQFVSIIASNHAIDCEGDIMDMPWSLKNNYVTIGDNVWIGAGSIILPGVVVGNGAVIAAGSVVTKNIGENQVHAGVPARLLRLRQPPSPQIYGNSD